MAKVDDIAERFGVSRATVGNYLNYSYAWKQKWVKRVGRSLIIDSDGLEDLDEIVRLRREKMQNRGFKSGSNSNLFNKY